MRKFSLLVLVVVFSGWSSESFGTSYSDAVIADNPVSFWRFDETAGTTAVDSVGTSDGTYVGAPQFSQAGPPNPPFAGMTGDQSVGLSGQFVDFGTNLNLRLDQTDFTLEAWVKPDGLGQSQNCLGPGGTCDAMFFQAGDASGANTQKSVSWRIFQAHGGTTGHLDMAFYGVPGFPDPHSGNTPAGLTIDLNVWTHLAVSYDQATRVGSFYTNGEKTYSHTYGSGLAYDYLAGTQIGAEYLPGSIPHNADYDGWISDFAIYDNVLSDGQVQAHYLAATVPEPNTALLLGIGMMGLGMRRRQRTRRGC